MKALITLAVVLGGSLLRWLFTRLLWLIAIGAGLWYLKTDNPRAGALFVTAWIVAEIRGLRPR